METQTFMSRLKHAWNVFKNKDPPYFQNDYSYSYTSSFRPDRVRFSKGNEKSIVNAVYNKIALDCSQISIRHVQLDENGRFLSELKTGLNKCLSLEANVDQTSRAFIQDAVISMLDEGSMAIVPVDTTDDPSFTDSYDINSCRVGKIIEWRPNAVKVSLYNETNGKKEDVVVMKKYTAIIENPFYSVMNEPNSTLQRLIRKLNLLDAVDEQSSSGKLDMIVQLPYVIRSEARQIQAEKRLQSIETQLKDSRYGIAYTDGTEKVIQLNRPVENNLMSQIEYLTNLLYSQLGITQAVLDGSASEAEMLNYNNRVIEPIVSAIAAEMKRKFLTETARTQGKSISYFTNPFKLVPVNQLAEISDKLTRNEILSSNEIRQIIGFKPSSDPKADELRNKNINQPESEESNKNN